MNYTTMLPLETQFGDFKAYFNAAAVRGDGGLVLVDTGLPGFLQKIEETMAKEGLQLSEVTKIIITHHDGDHIGSLKAVLDKYPGIEVLSTAEQAPYIEGKQRPLRLQLAEKKYASCTSEEEKRALAEEIQRLSVLETIGKVTVVADGQVLPERGIKIIEVSGHMPGHLCVYVPADKALITGDALTAREGRLNPPDPKFTLDMPTAMKSLEKLLDYDIENVVCYHGGLVTGNIGERLREIIKTGK
ncbi:Glyoxylase, beta-lactamase superfamily II [Sporobacter termitidis DSM 10068]|uniref:Glyoxylase, beta-lactamase superfamily II n=1 Tax=Sporobacter termitidis DSM 10068 TaxID=1123282 RepID=A0A1M5Z910_9FIRM|nr:MBL fold metallo-hydrolase [Sporobacter termitidis]SHI20672.1 Glyoxylase, beta-lactamase superfamily II [Sporobacter termitidis DSM 10068]